MNLLNNELANALLGRDLQTYYEVIEEAISSEYSIIEYTHFFTSQLYSEEGDELKVRSVRPRDIRMRKIDLCFDKKGCVHSIKWELHMGLRELMEVFGEAEVTYDAVKAITQFEFQSTNPEIKNITAYYEGKIIEPIAGNFEIQYEFGEYEPIYNPEIKFLLFNLFVKEKLSEEVV